MNRNDLRILAGIRLNEARKLLSEGFPHGAYYLAGFAVECGLKACIAKKARRYDFPDKDLTSKSYSHNFEQLVAVAGLEQVLKTELHANPAFEVNWAIVLGWKVDSRYNTLLTDPEARDLVQAITARTDGVMHWIRSQW